MPDQIFSFRLVPRAAWDYTASSFDKFVKAICISRNSKLPLCPFLKGYCILTNKKWITIAIKQATPTRQLWKKAGL
jgi:hypothetical protein